MKKNKLISFILAVAVAFSMFTFVFASVSADTPTFDENNIILRFPALSDVHLGSSETDEAADHFIKALTYSKSFGNLDAIMFAGDYTDFGRKEQVNAFASILDKNLDLKKTRAVIAPGNHEWYIKTESNQPFDVIKNTIEALGNDKVYQGATQEELDAGNYVTTVNGFTMIGLNCWKYSGGVEFRPEDLAWLDKQLAKAPTDKPVFVAMHPAIKGTMYGSNFGAYWATTTEDLYNIMKKYPQAVTFSGHLHFPVTDDTSIWQGDFTALATGSVRYGSIEDVDKDGNRYLGMAGTEPSEATKISNGLIVEVDKNNNTRITRLDFTSGKVIKKPFVIDAPKADKSHLERYKTENRLKTNKAPEFASTAKVTAKAAAEPNSKMLEVEFDAATDDDMVHSYQVKLISKEYKKVIKLIPAYSDFMWHYDPANMSKKVKLSIGEKSMFPFYVGYFEDYYVEIVAIDSFGVKSTPIVSEVYKGTGKPPVEVVIDETPEPDWQYKLYNNFNTYQEGYKFIQGTDFNSWPTPDMATAAQHQPMAKNGFQDSISLTTKLCHTDRYFDVLFADGGSGYKVDHLGAKEFWMWIDTTGVELKDISIGFRTGNVYGDEYLTNNVVSDKMKVFIQNEDKTWKAVDMVNGYFNLGNYKGFIRFDASYFVKGESTLYPADLKGFVIGYAPKDQNSVGKTFAIDQVGFAGPEIQGADGTVKELLEGKQFSSYIKSDQASIKDTSTKYITDFDNDVFIVGKKMSEEGYAPGKNIRSTDKYMGAYLDMEVISYPTIDKPNNKAITLENLDNEFNGLKNTSGEYTRVVFKPRKSIGSDTQFLPKGTTIANDSKESGIIFYVDTTNYNDGGLSIQPMLHEADFLENGEQNIEVDPETQEEYERGTARGVAEGAEYYIEIEDGSFALGGRSVRNYVNIPSNYKGHIKIPFASLEMMWSDSVDANKRVDLQKVDMFTFYYGCYANRTGPVIFDNIGFYGPEFKVEEPSEPSTPDPSTPDPSTPDETSSSNAPDTSNNGGTSSGNTSTNKSESNVDTGSTGASGMVSTLAIAGIAIAAAVCLKRKQK